MARPATRPNPLDPGVAEAISLRLIAGESIRSICEDVTMPAITMVYQAMATDGEFRNTIARAREAQQDAIIDQTIEMADTATAENYNAVKLKIWARQWRASKLAPKKYGERLNLDAKVEVEDKRSEADIAASVKALLEKAKATGIDVGSSGGAPEGGERAKDTDKEPGEE